MAVWKQGCDYLLLLHVYASIAAWIFQPKTWYFNDTDQKISIYHSRIREPRGWRHARLSLRGARYRRQKGDIKTARPHSTYLIFMRYFAPKKNDLSSKYTVFKVSLWFVHLWAAKLLIAKDSFVERYLVLEESAKTSVWCVIFSSRSQGAAWFHLLNIHELRHTRAIQPRALRVAQSWNLVKGRAADMYP